MESSVTVSISHGWWVDGARHREAELRPLTARDEAALAERRAAAPAAEVTWLLGRCLRRLGPLEEPGEEAARALTVGDRESLALQLRRLMLGETMACVLRCPRCAEVLDLDLRVGDLLQAPRDDAADHHEAGARHDGHEYAIRFRLPTGADQEAVAGEADGAAALLRRCVEAVRRDGRPVSGDLPPAVAARLSARMGELDPQGVVLLDMTCPACGAGFTSPFSPGAHLVEELARRAEGLLVEVHTLATHYHWSESEILAMPRRRRHAYLDLLDRAVAAGAAP